MNDYKLVYFNSRGRAEVIRLIFAVAEQKYEDTRIKAEDWPSHKNKGIAPFLKLPYLVVTNSNGSEFILSQSMSIARYLCRKFNLLGETEQEHAECEMYCDQLNDLFNEFGGFFFENDETKKSILMDNFRSVSMPQNMEFFEAKLKNTGTGFLIGKKLTIADLSIIVSIETLTNGGFKIANFDQICENFPLIKKHQTMIKSIPQIAAWLKSRSNTDF